MSERHRGQDGEGHGSRPELRITPEPTEEELAAIASAVMALSRSWVATNGEVRPSEDRWRAAARREALRSPLEQGKRGVLT